MSPSLSPSSSRSSLPCLPALACRFLRHRYPHSSFPSCSESSILIVSRHFIPLPLVCIQVPPRVDLTSHYTRNTIYNTTSATPARTLPCPSPCGRRRLQATGNRCHEWQLVPQVSPRDNSSTRERRVSVISNFVFCQGHSSIQAIYSSF